MDARSRWSVKVVVGLAAGLALLIVGGWSFWFARQQWGPLDDAAAEFRVPSGFTEVARVRQGSSFCFVTCESGEPLITIVLESDFDDPYEACRALRGSVEALTGTAGPGVFRGTCGWEGPLEGSATVYAGAAERERIVPGSGQRWTEVVPIPESPVAAFVEFNSGLE